MHGWRYEETVVWDKGLAHIAGNVNSRTIRGLPVVTEIAVRYTRKVALRTRDGAMASLKDWLREECRRSGLPLSQSNTACGVANAATRKYLTGCHLWYCPPGEAVVAMAAMVRAFRRQEPESRIFRSTGSLPERREWERLRAKWNHVHALTNVWRESPVHGPERISIPAALARCTRTRSRWR